MLRWCSVQYFVDVHEQMELGMFESGGGADNFGTQCRKSCKRKKVL